MTRRKEQSEALTDGLVALGAEVVEVPLLELAPPADPEPLVRAVAEIERYDWLVFTSANAVHALAESVEGARRILPPRARVASVGPSTSRTIRERLGVEPDLEPSADYRAEGLLQAFGDIHLEGRRVLLPVSARAREVLAQGLRRRGALVDVVEAYRTVTPAGAREALDHALRAGADLVTLASPSAVEGLVGALGAKAAELAVAVIGPVTEHAARAAGLDVCVVAAPATAEGLVDAIERRFARGRP